MPDHIVTSDWPIIPVDNDCHIEPIFEGNTSAVNENWRPFASSVRDKALCLAAIVKPHYIHHS